MAAFVSRQFTKVEFALHWSSEEPAHHQELYTRLQQHTRFRLSQLGTVIWYATCASTGEERVLKEFSFADASSFWRSLPDPSWRDPGRAGVVAGELRGLSPARAEAYDQLLSGEMKREVRRVGPSNHPSFLPQFSSYSFELEAMICQFARLYGCHRLVQAHRWGAIQLPTSPLPRYVLEMEPLEEWSLPPVHDVFLSLHELMEMMMAVTQLHSMRIPLRCYPPELVRDVGEGSEGAAAHPYHYDLAPDQFLVRRSFNGVFEERELVLIDFNSARMGATELSNFSWGMVPGKDFFQPPERRSDLQSRKSLPSFATNPACDLYSLSVIALLLLGRTTPEQTELSQLPGWETLSSFYQWLGTKDTQAAFLERLQNLLPEQIPLRTLQPLLSLISHTLILDPKERMELLTSHAGLQWQGTEDWMLVPKAMNFIARRCAQRQFQIGWREPTLVLRQGEESCSLADWLVPEQCHFHGGPMERDRVPLPPFAIEDVFFLQSEGQTPFAMRGHVLTHQAGEATLYACFGGCIDFDNPLRVVIEEASSRESSHGPRSAPRQTSEVPARGGDPSDFAFSSGGDTSPSPRAPSSLPRGSQQRPATLVFEGRESGGALSPEKPPVEELYEVSSLSGAAKGVEARHARAQNSVSHLDAAGIDGPFLRAPVGSSNTMAHDREAVETSPRNEALSEEASEAPFASDRFGLPRSSSSRRESVFQMTPLEAPSFLLQDGRIGRASFDGLPPVQAPEQQDSVAMTMYDSVAPDMESLQEGVLDQWGVPLSSSDPTPVEIKKLQSVLGQQAVPREYMPVSEQSSREPSFWANLRTQAAALEDLEELEFLIAAAESEPACTDQLETRVHLHSLAVMLSWRLEEETPDFVRRIRTLGGLREQVESDSPLLGLLLNNLSVMMYEAIHYKQDLPPSWERLLGFVPIDEMGLWLELTAGSVSDGGRLQEIRQQVTETLYYCQRVEAAIESSWSKGDFV